MQIDAAGQRPHCAPHACSTPSTQPPRTLLLSVQAVGAPAARADQRFGVACVALTAASALQRAGGRGRRGAALEQHASPTGWPPSAPAVAHLLARAVDEHKAILTSPAAAVGAAGGAACVPGVGQALGAPAARRPEDGVVDVSVEVKVGVDLRHRVCASLALARRRAAGCAQRVGTAHAAPARMGHSRGRL